MTELRHILRANAVVLLCGVGFILLGAVVAVMSIKSYENDQVVVRPVEVATENDWLSAYRRVTFGDCQSVSPSTTTDPETAAEAVASATRRQDQKETVFAGEQESDTTKEQSTSREQSTEPSTEPSTEAYTEPEEEYEEPEEEYAEPANSSSVVYSPDYFQKMGMIDWGGWTWTWYSERVLPGTGLHIPGRYTDSQGYVRDENGYLCLASSTLAWGTVVDTPFGSQGRVYDSGCDSDVLDVYVGW